ncbi:unnamed protein product [Anisakis simplex]|uniref:Uncharacterized protein n=1 Tax=Anisakis simplex TaxID=6269 RepID=A0A0M3K936_ANISI|nr:unnamed protein product [Anisakis simplex]
MSNFLKMFRSKKGGDKENDAPTEEESSGHRLSSRGSVRRDAKRYSSRFTDDTFLKPSAPYHTVTQPKQTKGSRSCVGVGRDEYDHFRFEQPFRERNGSRYNNKRLYSNASEFGRETNLSSSININTYDPELGDSDDSYDSIRRSRTLKSDDTIKALEAKLESFAYRLRKEEDKKNAYKQKLMSERIIRQHVEAKFVEDIQRLTKLIDTLKNENKSYRNKINSLESVLDSAHLISQLKESKHMSRDLKLRNESAMNTHHFTTTNTPSSLFNSPPSTSNEQSSLNGAGEILCTASGSTLPIHSIVNPFNSTDDIDEVKNFRISEVRSFVLLSVQEFLDVMHQYQRYL